MIESKILCCAYEVICSRGNNGPEAGSMKIEMALERAPTCWKRRAKKHSALIGSDTPILKAMPKEIVLMKRQFSPNLARTKGHTSSAQVESFHVDFWSLKQITMHEVLPSESYSYIAQGSVHWLLVRRRAGN